MYSSGWATMTERHCWRYLMIVGPCELLLLRWNRYAYFNLPLYAHPSTWAKKAYLQCSAGDLRSPLFLSLSASSWPTFPQSKGWTSDHGWSWLARRRSCIATLSNLFAKRIRGRMVSWAYIANFDHGRASPEKLLCLVEPVGLCYLQFIIYF